jgi:hypothetical protein
MSRVGGNIIVRGVCFIWLLASLSGCNNNAVPSQSPDLSTSPASTPDLLPAGNVRIIFSGTTGSGVRGDAATGVSFPLPTPTTIPIDGVSYSYYFAAAGQYNMSLEWMDKANNNQGWTASFGGDPGTTNPYISWPLTQRTITVNEATNFDMGLNNGFGTDKVAIVAGERPQPNILIITVRSVANPTTDYGILYQAIRGS